jgi:hypothetical protein
LVVNLDDTSSDSCSKCTVWNRGQMMCRLPTIHILFWQSWVNRVGIFNWINVKLQTFKLNKVGSNERYVSPLQSSGSLRQHWRWRNSDEASKVINSISYDRDIHFLKPLDFPNVHASNLLSGFLSRIEHLSLKIRRLKKQLPSL